MRTTIGGIPAAALLLLAGCGGAGAMQGGGGAAANAAAGIAMSASDHGSRGHGAYVQRNLVSDGAVAADHVDANLVNSWGLDALPTTPWWVADNGAGVATLYDGEGIAQPTTPGPLVVALPGASGPAAPAGLVANPTSDFVITLGGTTAPARFLFASEDGTISAWTRTTPLPTAGVVVVDASAAAAVFKGLALVSTPAGSTLFATDFHNAMVRAYDGSFAEVPLPAGAFTDPGIPAGFAPFGIRALRGVLLVTYAMQDDARHDDVAGPGLGYVDAYSPGGRLLARIASRGKLNSPWGLTLAPAGFGPESFRLLVGNFGDGHIVSFGLHGGDGHGRDEQHGSGGQGDDLDDDGFYLESASGPIVIDGLWALSFGNGAAAGPTTTLFFTAGPNKEADGLFGRIDFTPGMH
jgi:uncharacterized protein (TIGR03118 family)